MGIHLTVCTNAYIHFWSDGAAAQPDRSPPPLHWVVFDVWCREGGDGPSLSAGRWGRSDGWEGVSDPKNIEMTLADGSEERARERTQQKERDNGRVVVGPCISNQRSRKQKEWNNG